MRLAWALALVILSGLPLACGRSAQPGRAPNETAPTAPPAAAPPAPAQAPREADEAPAGAAAEAEPAPPQRALDSSDEPDELAAAEQALVRADSELAALAMGTTPEPAAQGAASKPKKGEAGGACGDICQAFASLLRARDAICRIDGADGQRCSRANLIVERHQARGDACGCRG